MGSITFPNDKSVSRSHCSIRVDSKKRLEKLMGTEGDSQDPSGNTSVVLTNYVNENFLSSHLSQAGNGNNDGDSGKKDNQSRWLLSQNFSQPNGNSSSNNNTG